MSVVDWLLDSDPAIRWQVLRDRTDAPPGDLAADPARVEPQGWGAPLPAPARGGRRWALPHRVRLGALLVRLDHQRPRRPPGVRARDRRLRRGAGGAAGRRGVPAGARPVPPPLDGRGREGHLSGVRLPVLLALR